MKIQIRKNWGDILLYFLLTRTERVEGIASDLMDTSNHIILWDFDDIKLSDVEKSLRRVKEKYGLNDIFIMSDKEGSYRAMCFDEKPFNEYLKILLDTVGLDYMFFKWTVKRDYATIRATDKSGRKISNEIISVITDNEVCKIPSNILNRVKGVWFEVDKGGKDFMLGDFTYLRGGKS